uniref:Dipeptidylpeptidase IV N-terminal domain-containing protein n=1 Tax=Mola mola TaxID=94237 RepID=A0A3Q3XGC8_MOLML
MTASREPNRKKRTEAQDEVEFVDVSPAHRNWKGIAISLLVILVVCSLIAMSAVVLTPAELPGSSRSRLTVADLYAPAFAIHDPEATWISGEHFRPRNLKSSVSFLCQGEFKKPLRLPSSSRPLPQIYIFENNIYYQADMRSSSLRITSSGRDGLVFNGLADWLYEEEILGSHLAHWWSPDGEKLAFLTIDDTLVPNTVVPRFTGGTYPRGLRQPYPAAGQTNPAVRLSVVNLSGPTHTRELQPPDQLRLRDFYITMVKWISNTQLAVRWLNRPQNASLLTVCDASVGVCRQVGETSDTWLCRQTQEPMFSADGGSFFLALPIRQGGQGAFHHLTMFTTQSEQDDVRYLTSGDWEVTKIVAYDENDHVIYFLSTEDSAHHRHLYSVSTLGLFPRQCLTCGLKDECSFFDADVSPDVQYAVLHCKGQRTSAWRPAGWPHPSVFADIFFKWLPLKLLYPPAFSESLLYGLLLIVGSAPGHQAVTDEFRPDWDWVLVGSEQVIVARLDGRGSGFRGQRYLNLTSSLRSGAKVYSGSWPTGEFLCFTSLVPFSKLGRRAHVLTFFFCVFIALVARQIYPDEGHFLSTRSQKQLTRSLVGHFEGCLLDAASSLDQQQRDDE